MLMLMHARNIVYRTMNENWPVQYFVCVCRTRHELKSSGHANLQTSQTDFLFFSIPIRSVITYSQCRFYIHHVVAY